MNGIQVKVPDGRFPVSRFAAAYVILGLSMAGAAGVQAAASGAVAGLALDAIGRPLAGVAVDLVEIAGVRAAGYASRTTVTDAGGAWRFHSVAPGDYVVRIAPAGQVAGVPVTVAGAATVGDVLIVAPSAAAAVQVPAVVAGTLLTDKTAAIAAAVAAAAVVTSVFVLRDAS